MFRRPAREDAGRLPILKAGEGDLIRVPRTPWPENLGNLKLKLAVVNPGQVEAFMKDLLAGAWA